MPHGARLAHLALVVRGLDAAEQFCMERLGLRPSGRAVAPGEGVRMAFIPVGGVEIELIEPVDPGSPPARFLAARGEGIHHLALEVPDLTEALARATRAGLVVAPGGSRPGAHGTRIAFLSPKGTHGVLIELVERPDEKLG